MQTRVFLAGLTALLLAGGVVFAQAKPPVPQPFPKPAQPGQTQAQPAADKPGAAQSAKADPPTEASLGLPIYPTAQYLASYDAGQGQRYCLFGSAATFIDIVAYYRTVLKQKGELVFEEPPTHMFEVGRFREDTMAFPPGVTVKDYTWGGSEGYPNPTPGAQPPRFKTIIQMVAVVPAVR
jgi:hypothetical protein